MSPKVPETLSQPRFAGSFKYTPLTQLRNLFVGFCQGLFHYAPPGCYHWEEDEDTTEIVIRDEAPVKEEIVAKRPLICITRGPMQFYGFGLDDMVEYRLDIDRKTKGVLVPGTMIINCCSRVSIEAENIAWIVAEYIWLLRDYLLKAGLFDTGRHPQIGSPTPAGSIVADGKGDEFICVQVSVPYQFHRTSEFTPLGKQIVRGIETRLNTTLYQPRNEGPAASSHEYPVNVQEERPPAFFGNRGEDELPKIPHPFDPARTVVVRKVRPYDPRNKPQVGVPIDELSVEQSTRSRS